MVEAVSFSDSGIFVGGWTRFLELLHGGLPVSVLYDTSILLRSDNSHVLDVRFDLSGAKERIRVSYR
jgi:hypothetical protein